MYSQSSEYFGSTQNHNLRGAIPRPPELRARNGEVLWDPNGPPDARALLGGAGGRRDGPREARRNCVLGALMHRRDGRAIGSETCAASIGECQRCKERAGGGLVGGAGGRGQRGAGALIT